jgi:3-phosphoglycerate kinase
MIDTAKDLMAMAKSEGKEILLPVDAVCAQGFPSGPMDINDTKTFDLTPDAGIPDGWMGLDVGPATIQKFHEALSTATKICFNGPMVRTNVFFMLDGLLLCEGLCSYFSRASPSNIHDQHSLHACTFYPIW